MDLAICLSKFPKNELPSALTDMQVMNCSMEHELPSAL
jgi:hypothetical protein